MDTNIGAIANLGHIQKNGVNLGANWKVMRDVNFSINSGTASYTEPTATGGQQTYRSTYGNLTLIANF